jgi:predicted Zn-ribbon and HTH transcriptional regulator
MYFQCQICGYKYNFFINEMKVKCMICQSAMARIENPEIEIE